MGLKSRQHKDEGENEGERKMLEYFVVARNDFAVGGDRRATANQQRHWLLTAFSAGSIFLFRRLLFLYNSPPPWPFQTCSTAAFARSQRTMMRRCTRRGPPREGLPTSPDLPADQVPATKALTTKQTARYVSLYSQLRQPNKRQAGAEDDLDEDTAPDGEDSASAQDDDQNDNTDIQSSINNISFGALARAQESLGAKPKKKSRKPANDSESPDPSHDHQPSPLDDVRERIRQAREHKQTQKEKKASKHAPTVQSSKRAVTRKRPVVDLPSVPKARDPRFDPTILSQSGRGSGRGGAAYSFLDEYRASELKDLKARLAKTKDPKQKEALKREVRSAGDRMRSIENKRRAEDVKARHKSEEKRLIREGKKSAPYYLKKSELRQQALVRKYQDMGSRERAKALERRRKKAASRDRKEMPMERRGVGGDDTTGESGRKRKRMA
jgi:ribosomal RNA-processing protein 36